MRRNPWRQKFWLQQFTRKWRSSWSPTDTEAKTSRRTDNTAGGRTFAAKYGRTAAAVAELYKVSLSTVYRARTVLKHGWPELLDELRNGDIPVETAYKRLLKERGRNLEQTG